MRHDQRIPPRDVEARQHGFGDRRQLRRAGEALRRGDGEAAQLPFAHQRQRAAEGVEDDVDAPRDDVGHGGSGAAVGNVGHLDAGAALEQLAGEMGRAAGAGRRERGPAAVLLGIGDELRDRLRRRGVRHRHDIRIGGEQGHRREIGECIVAERREQKAVDGKRQRREQDRVAVRRRMGDRLGADIGAAAALVLDDDLVAGGFRRPAPRMRAMASVPPPGTYGTTMRTTRCGQGCVAGHLNDVETRPPCHPRLRRR